VSAVVVLDAEVNVEEEDAVVRADVVEEEAVEEVEVEAAAGPAA
jgi:hypothetical protein